MAKDVSAYRTARLAERQGTPLAPEPPAPAPETPETPAPAAETPETPERQLSKRQQDLNERIREAVARVTAEKDAEIARLRTAAPAPPTEPAKVTEPPRPKLTDFEAAIGSTYSTYAEAVEAYQDARDAWKAAEQTRGEAERTAQREAVTRQQRASEMARTYAERMKAADPTRLANVDPRINALVPVSLLAPGAEAQIGNHVAEAVFTSEDPAGLLEHFSTAAEFDRVLALPTAADVYREIGRIEGRRQAPAAPTPKPVTTAPPPPTTLGTKTSDAAAKDTDAAVVSGNVAAYRTARLRERVAAMR